MKDIKGYEGKYAITKEGKVWSYRSKKFLKPTKGANGYLTVLFSIDKKQKRVYIHRLVAETFLGDIEGLDVHHKDEDKTNNHVSNLAIITRQENINAGTRNERVAIKRGKVVVCLDTGEEFYSTGEAARQLGIPQSGIQRCCTGKLKSTHNLHFKYKEVN